MTYNTYFCWRGQQIHQSAKGSMAASLAQLRKNAVRWSWMTGPDGRTVCWLDGEGRLLWSGLGQIGGK